MFILAGTQVMAASLVLVLGNYFCIRGTPAAAAEAAECHQPPGSSGVDSREVERFLKAEPEKNGEVAHTPETSV